MLYYFKTGDINTSSYQTLRWNMMINKLKAQSNGGALIKCSTPIKNNPDDATETLKQFIKEISPILTEYLI